VRCYGLKEVGDRLAQFYEDGEGRQFIEIPYNDRRFRWSDADRCSNGGLPAVPSGQSSDCRFPRPDGTSLHAHWYEDRVRFHLDQFDPQAGPLQALGHFVVETNVLPGGVVGLGARLLLGGGPVGWMAFGAAALIGANTSSKPEHVWVVEGVDYAGRLRLRAVKAASA